MLQRLAGNSGRIAVVPIGADGEAARPGGLNWPPKVDGVLWFAGRSRRSGVGRGRAACPEALAPLGAASGERSSRNRAPAAGTWLPPAVVRCPPPRRWTSRGPCPIRTYLRVSHESAVSVAGSSLPA